MLPGKFTFDRDSVTTPPSAVVKTRFRLSLPRLTVCAVIDVCAER